MILNKGNFLNFILFYQKHVSRKFFFFLDVVLIILYWKRKYVSISGTSYGNIFMLLTIKIMYSVHKTAQGNVRAIVQKKNNLHTHHTYIFLHILFFINVNLNIHWYANPPFDLCQHRPQFSTNYASLNYQNTLILFFVLQHDNLPAIYIYIFKCIRIYKAKCVHFLFITFCNLLYCIILYDQHIFFGDFKILFIQKLHL